MHLCRHSHHRSRVEHDASLAHLEALFRGREDLLGDFVWDAAALNLESRMAGDDEVSDRFGAHESDYRGAVAGDNAQRSIRGPGCLTPLRARRYAAPHFLDHPAISR